MQKTVFVDSIGADVVIARRKGTRSMRLSIRSDGRVLLSIPYGVSESNAQRFLNEKAEWIIKHTKPVTTLYNSDHIGKSHRLVFESYDGSQIRTRVSNNQIIIKLPADESWDSSEAQAKAKKAAEKALLSESKHLLPQRLEVLSQKFSIVYKSCDVKKLKSRWGSCDSQNAITLNIYLIQLDWALIDYVILHELAHTKHKHHQQDFWNFLEGVLPDYKERRKLLKTKATEIISTRF